MNRLLHGTLALAIWAASSASARAVDFSFTGHLAGDNDVALFSFSLASTAEVTLRTWSYAGGTNAAGSLIAAGGFDPIVSLFFGSGASAILIDANDDGLGVPADPGNGLARDSLLESSALPSGTYTVALTQVANFANGPTLGDGFLGAGNAAFDGRSDAWALDIRGVTAAGVIPEPPLSLLTLLGLVAVGGASRRRRPSLASSA